MTTEAPLPPVDVPAEAILVSIQPTPEQWSSLYSDVQRVVIAAQDRDAQELAQSARLLLQGLATLHPSRIDLGLSGTDRHILWLMSTGHSNTEVARRAGVARDYITNTLLSKMEVKDRAHAVAKALRNGLLA